MSGQKFCTNQISLSVQRRLDVLDEEHFVNKEVKLDWLYKSKITYCRYTVICKATFCYQRCCFKFVLNNYNYLSIIVFFKASTGALYQIFSGWRKMVVGIVIGGGLR